jgi:putative ABC transport system substrate-binding protein
MQPMHRRPFLTSFGLLAGLPGRSQAEATVISIGLLDRQYPTPLLHQRLFARLEELGWVEGRNLKVERRLLTEPSQRAAAAAELAASGVALVIAPGDGTAQAMHATRAAMPIVMPWSISPVKGGLASSLARPGGQFTGLTIDTGPEQYGRSLQLFKEAMPGLGQLPVLWDRAASAQEDNRQVVAAAAARLGVQLHFTGIDTAADLQPALLAIARGRPKALWVWAGPVLDVRVREVVDFALQQRLPTVASFSGYVTQGCLMAYSVRVADLYRRAADFVDKVLKGTRPEDLPIEQPMTFELALNLKSARAIGFTFPKSVLVQADRLVE